MIVLADVAAAAELRRRVGPIAWCALEVLVARSRLVEMLEQIHRFSEPWEASASLLFRTGDPRGLDAYQAHRRIVPGTLEDHLARIASSWIDRHLGGDTTAMVASSNDHVDAINAAVQTARIAAGHLDPDVSVTIAGGERAHRGDVIATRRNDRRLITTAGEPVRNRETWTRHRRPSQRRHHRDPR